MVEPSLAAKIADRITEYLSQGGLFNPENMEHIRVRDLLIDCRAALLDEKPVSRRLHEFEWQKDTFPPKYLCQVCGAKCGPADETCPGKPVDHAPSEGNRCTRCGGSGLDPTSSDGIELLRRQAEIERSRSKDES